ncbi:uncharacterized protein [Macrobrachium rosenbergii]|uniref:uncharacterized protein n=1 Tax=Macrobrachium rosenbergii TaxID=79674 RepID=UPI0034D53748
MVVESTPQVLNLLLRIGADMTKGIVDVAHVHPWLVYVFEYPSLHSARIEIGEEDSKGRTHRHPVDLGVHMATMGDHKSNIIDRRLREAAKQLREKEDITILRADKTATFVLINTKDYHWNRKLDNILADSTKFQRITNNPVDKIRREANRIIETVNAASNAFHLPPIMGDYDLEYIYGNVKTHKQGNLLRPIISQIPAPTYQLAKRLSAILTPYVPSSHSLKSSVEFLEAL